MSRRLLTVALAAAGVVLLVPASPASAHPLGNFTINQYIGVTVATDHVSAKAIVDTAEIPTLQDRPTLDVDADGRISDAERAAFAARSCAEIGRAVVARLGPVTLVWTVRASIFGYQPGAGGLDTSRITCLLWAAADGRGDFAIDNGYLADRIGWREMTVVGDGVRLVAPSVGESSVSGELTAYPPDLLTTSLDVRSATARVEPGPALPGAAARAPLAAVSVGGDPVSRWMAMVDRHFADLAGATALTPLVGLLAIGLALLLGAGHAALPGHGKTILAAYLAGKRGRPRDAWTIAGTVTLTHTGAVLVLGLILTAGVAIAGERILAWLGLVSGVVVVGVGVAMLSSLVRRGGPHRPGDHPRDGHSHGGPGHSHDGHSHADHGSAQGRLGLAGIGLAGGLVPSPSALVVLLAAIGLGRTAFGIVLVVAYGAGMALMLAGAGLALLAVQRRLARRARARSSRLSTVAARLHAATPAATATLVLLVGAGLALRAATTVL